MPEQVLCNCYVLVVEDEFFLAEDLAYELKRAGAIVVGQAGTIEDAIKLIDTEPCLDCAILDVNLGGKPVFPVADHLSDRDIPFVFTTGYDATELPLRFKDAARFEKPFNVTTIVRSLKQVIGA